MVIIIAWCVKMGRKKREGVSTSPRYELKIYRIFATGVPEDLAKKVASAVTTARDQGIGAYKDARKEARAVLERREVPSLLHAPYYAFVNELVHKVQKRKMMTADELITKYEELGLDGSVLREIADEIGVEVKTTVTKPAGKTA